MQGGFFPLPKALFTNNTSPMGLAAKVLYAMILDRLSLSQKNRWTDEEGNVFALFAREEMALVMGVSRPTATKAFAELKRAGLVIEVTQGRNRPSRLYIPGGKILSDRKKVADSKNLSDRNNLGSEGKKFSAEGKNLYTSNLKEQTEITTLKGVPQKAPSPGHGNLIQINTECTKINLPYSEILNLYHKHCPGLPRVIKLTDRRKRTLRARWKHCSNLEEWQSYFKKAGESNFLSGQNDRGWTADFDFLINESNMVKVLEGKYDNRRQSKQEHDPIREVLERAMAQDAEEMRKQVEVNKC